MRVGIPVDGRKAAGGAHLSPEMCIRDSPYLVTILVLVLTSMRNKRENQPPESLGVPYFREER